MRARARFCTEGVLRAQVSERMDKAMKAALAQGKGNG